MRNLKIIDEKQIGCSQLIVIDSDTNSEVCKLIKINTSTDFNIIANELSMIHNIDGVSEIMKMTSREVYDAISIIKYDFITEEERSLLKAQIPELMASFEQNLREYGKAD